MTTATWRSVWSPKKQKVKQKHNQASVVAAVQAVGVVVVVVVDNVAVDDPVGELVDGGCAGDVPARCTLLRGRLQNRHLSWVG